MGSAVSTKGCPNSPFSWCDSARSKAVDRLADRLRKTLAGYRLAPPADNGDCDLFKPLYQNLFPRALRHQLGEYYTPDWLAAHVLDQVGYTGEPGQRLLDPACGSGTFLLMALRLRKKSGERREDRGKETGNEGLGIRDWGLGTTAGVFSGRRHDGPLGPSPLSPLPHIVGFDLNPLAVMTARANYLIALADLAAERRTGAGADLSPRFDPRNGEGGMGDREQFDFVVGNPPWIAWDNLAKEDRRATKPLWERYGLFSLSGSDARHGGGKKDLSMLMLYAAADRYLKPDGRLGMVVPQTLFQTRGAGDGFRRFRLGRGRSAAGRAARGRHGGLAPLRRRRQLDEHHRAAEGSRHGVSRAVFCMEIRGEGRGTRNEEMMNVLARPIDPARPTSPWLVEKRGQGSGVRDQEAERANPKSEIRNPKSLTPAPFYSAHLGANSGGANGVYWVDVLKPADGGVLVRNVTAKSKRAIETVQQVIEPDLLYPLLRWGDVGRWSAVPRGHILLVQDPATRTGIAEAMMRERFPLTLAYLERFRNLLLSRAAFRRYQGRGPFYSMYNVGPYTIAPNEGGVAADGPADQRGCGGIFVVQASRLHWAQARRLHHNTHHNCGRRCRRRRACWWRAIRRTRPITFVRSSTVRWSTS